MRMEVEGIILGISTNGKRGNDMKLMEVILRDENLDEAMKRVKSNKGVPGVDKMLVDEIDAYFETNRETIKKQILEKKYKPQPVKMRDNSCATACWMTLSTTVVIPTGLFCPFGFRI